MHKEWKQELEQLRLTDGQKERMKRAVQEKPRKTYRFVPMIVPLFAVVALWLLVTATGDSSVAPQTAASMEAEETETLFTLPQLMWTLATQLLIGLAFSLTIIVAKKVPQVQNVPFWQKIAALTKPKGVVVYVALLVAAMLGIVYMSITFSWAQTVLEWLIVCAVLANWMLISMLMLMSQKRSRCPHCEECMPIRQFMTFNYTTCKLCGGKIYLLQKGNQKMFVLQYSGMAIAYLMGPILGFTLWHIGVFFVGYMLFLFLYVFKYTMHYDKNESEMPPPLW